MSGGQPARPSAPLPPSCVPATGLSVAERYQTLIKQQVRYGEWRNRVPYWPVAGATVLKMGL